MKFALSIACLLLATTVGAKDHDYQKGVLVQMDSVHCGSSSSGAKSLVGEVVGTDNSKTKTQDLLCQEYLLQSDRVVYRIRPRDDKHPALLPIGETAQFRIDKDKLILRVAEGDGKEHQYQVVSMTPRTESASSSPIKN